MPILPPASIALPPAVVAAVVTRADVAGASPPVVPVRGASADLDRARDLDAAGAKAFREGSYRDAILFFSEAYRLGAPSIELWNLARCHERLEEPDAEVALLERFLDASDAQPADRAEAERVLERVRGRTSILVVDPGARGGVVVVDDRPVSASTTTPVVVRVAAGAHHVRVEREDGPTSTVEVEARFGKALSVHPADADDTTLVEAGRAEPGGPHLSASLEAGAFVPRLGAYTAPLAPAGALGVQYTYLARGHVELDAGLRFVWTQVRWASGTAPTPTGAGCALARDFVASDLSGFLTAGGAYRIGRRARVGAEVGFGFDTLVGSQAGGEVFDPSCDPSFGYRPVLRAGLGASYEVAPALRVVLSPAIVEAHPAFEGARGDATSWWLRFGATLGVGVDL